MNQISLDIGKRGGDVLTPLLETPFHPRLEALNINNDWYAWSGFKAPTTLSDEELEYFAIRSTTARCSGLGRSSSASARRSGTCLGCSTVPLASTSQSRKRLKPLPAWHCKARPPSPCCAMPASPASSG